MTTRETVERLADCMDRAIQRMAGYANASTEAAMLRALLDRAEKAEAERDAAYKAGQEDMRERAISAASKVGLSHGADAGLAVAQAVLSICCLPIKPHP